MCAFPTLLSFHGHKGAKASEYFPQHFADEHSQSVLREAKFKIGKATSVLYLGFQKGETK